MGVLKASFLFLRAWFVSRLHLTAENLALRQQLAVLQRSSKRPKLRPRDRRPKRPLSLLSVQETTTSPQMPARISVIWRDLFVPNGWKHKGFSDVRLERSQMSGEESAINARLEEVLNSILCPVAGCWPLVPSVAGSCPASRQAAICRNTSFVIVWPLASLMAAYKFATDSSRVGASSL